MEMKSLASTAGLMFALMTGLPPALAQTPGNSDALKPDFQTTDPCRAKVSKFEQTIGFIRQAQGNTAAAELKEKLLPAKLENEILFKEGYCGLARYLHEKKLDR